jgi:phage pi2 protein 07
MWILSKRNLVNNIELIMFHADIEKSLEILNRGGVILYPDRYGLGYWLRRHQCGSGRTYLYHQAAQ